MDGGGNGKQFAQHLTIKYDNNKRLISAFWYDTFANSFKFHQSNQAVTNFWSGILSPRPTWSPQDPQPALGLWVFLWAAQISSTFGPAPSTPHEID